MKCSIACCERPVVLVVRFTTHENRRPWPYCEQHGYKLRRGKLVLAWDPQHVAHVDEVAS